MISTRIGLGKPREKSHRAPDGPGGQPKATTADAFALDVRALHREGELVPGNTITRIKRRRDGTESQMGAEVQGHCLVIKYFFTSIAGGPNRGLALNEVVPFASTPCNYGGRRRWFRCMKCQRRVAVTYYIRGSCGCRCCHKLAYPSQRQRAADRARERAQRIRLRLGGSPSVFDPFPERPSGMRRATYQRLKDHAFKDESLNMAHLRAKVEKRGQGVASWK